MNHPSKYSTSSEDHNIPPTNQINEGKEEDEDVSDIFSWCPGVIVGLVWVVLSGGLTLFNYHLMQEEVFPHPTVLACIYMAAVTIWIILLRLSHEAWFPSWAIVTKEVERSELFSRKKICVL